jgi:tRNA nucleotidyltransferase (CCA-adding enzyme)
MEDRLNKRLTEDQNDFFNNLSVYIDKPLYFYGSINRSDYLPGKSDIDIDIFTDNESSTINMLCNYLNLDRKVFRKSFYKIDSKMVYGYKGKYEDEINNFKVEISIYNNKYKQIVLNDQEQNNVLPLYVTIVLIIFKFLYYNLGIISKNVYRKIKQYLMNKGGELKFILIDN